MNPDAFYSLIGPDGEMPGLIQMCVRAVIIM